MTPAAPQQSAAPKPPIDEARLRILTEEYREAGQLCRSYEQLTRTNNIVFMGFFVAVSGLLERSDEHLVDMLVFAVLGIAGSLLFLYVNLRTRRYYLIYLERAKEVEAELGLDLYRRGARELRTPRVPLFGWPITNKTVFLSVQIIAMIYFVLKILRIIPA